MILDIGGFKIFYVYVVSVSVLGFFFLGRLCVQFQFGFSRILVIDVRQERVDFCLREYFYILSQVEYCLLGKGWCGFFLVQEEQSWVQSSRERVQSLVLGGCICGFYRAMSRLVFFLVRQQSVVRGGVKRSMCGFFCKQDLEL